MRIRRLRAAFFLLLATRNSLLATHILLIRHWISSFRVSFLLPVNSCVPNTLDLLLERIEVVVGLIGRGDVGAVAVGVAGVAVGAGGEEERLVAEDGAGWVGVRVGWI